MAEKMALHVYDGGRWWPATSLHVALAMADEAIDAHRDMCDPEWPDSVEEIAIYEAPADSDEPDEDGRLVMRAVPFNERPDPTGQCDYWCDYKMQNANA